MFPSKQLHRISRSRITSRTYHELSYAEKGEPFDVLEYFKQDANLARPVSSHPDYTIPVQMMHAPWNPADKNKIQGKYPSPQSNPPPQPPSARANGGDWKVAGSEGWGHVMDHNGALDSPHLTPGSWVTLGHSGMGTFRSQLWLPPTAMIPVERGDELYDSQGPAAASLFQLGGTAFNMLTEFETLREGSVVVQNAGNSGVGWMVSQLCKFRQIQVISLVRRGTKTPEEYDLMVNALTENHTNTTRIVAEEDVLEDKDAFKSLQSGLPNESAVRLGINAVGGPSATLLLRLLAPGGTLVTYGGMSMKPVTVATPQLIFRDVNVRGYWHSRWMSQAFVKQKKHLVDQLVDDVLDHGVQCPPVQVFALSEMKEALEFELQQSKEAIRRKVVLDCRE